MVTLLHLSDIHVGSGFNHGRPNPETGLNTRLEDFARALERCIDRAIAEPVDAVLFGGDAFPDATPPPYVQQIVAGQFCRLVEAGIPTVLLVGNHDQHAQGQGGASLSIYRTLGVPGVVVGDRLHTHRLTTANGDLQVVTLPWLNHSTLLTRPEVGGLPLAAVNDLMMQRLRTALEGEVRHLDPTLPTVLLAHAMVDTATYGAERFLAAGRSFTVPLALLAQPSFDYVALGHVHRHQILCDHPLTLYPGSIERVDFSEEKEAKGYVLVQVERGRAKAEFCPLPVRPFHTLTLDLTTSDDPQATLLTALGQAPLDDAVVRCFYQLHSHQLEQIDPAALAVALARAHTYSLHPTVQRPASLPHPTAPVSPHLNPLDALQLYIAHRNHLTDLEPALLQAAEGLLADDPTPVQPDPLPVGDEPGPIEPPSQQLRLL